VNVGEKLRCHYAHTHSEAALARRKYEEINFKPYAIPICVDWPADTCTCIEHNFAQQMCEELRVTGKCTYSQKCRFAHSKEEMQRARGIFNIGPPSRLPVFNNLRQHIKRIDGPLPVVK